MQYVLSELCEQVVTARAAQRPVFIRGGATRLFYGEPLEAGPRAQWLDLAPYQGVIRYEPSELVLTARAGTPLAEVEALLESQGQMLAFEPPRFGPAGTLGGCIAAGLAGPRRMASGRVADFVLGTRMLSANGDVLRFGGEVMKNVAGYDLSRLLVGSLGVLGVLVEASVKVAPRPAQEATRLLSFDEADALACCLRWRAQPLPVSATAWVADPEGRSGRLAVRLSGNASAVRQACAAIGGEPLEAAPAAAFWASLRDQTHAFFQARPLWRVVVPAGAPPLGTGPTLIEWGGTLRWLAADAPAALLREQVQALGGSASLYHYDALPAGVSALHPLSPVVLQLHQRLKREFDPTGIFNPRRLHPAF